MKLEEVLPAMREGRVARWGDMKYRVQGNCLQAFLGSNWAPTENTASDMLDGWTLEPEPKVEWPKGSLQWAETEANRRGLTYIKRRNFHLSTPVVDLRHHIFSDEARHALDWEVVP